MSLEDFIKKEFQKIRFLMAQKVQDISEENLAYLRKKEIQTFIGFLKVKIQDSAEKGLFSYHMEYEFEYLDAREVKEIIKELRKYDYIVKYFENTLYPNDTLKVEFVIEW
jgi:hypothetical protein